jgi:hypothetical protein
MKPGTVVTVNREGQGDRQIWHLCKGEFSLASSSAGCSCDPDLHLSAASALNHGDAYKIFYIWEKLYVTLDPQTKVGQ